MGEDKGTFKSLYISNKSNLIVIKRTKLYANLNILSQKHWGSTKIDPNIFNHIHQYGEQEIILPKGTTKMYPLIVTQFQQ